DRTIHSSAATPDHAIFRTMGGIPFVITAKLSCCHRIISPNQVADKITFSERCPEDSGQSSAL
ncbi:MAG: hypothetical protein PVJ19_19975, partial [Desulfobacteraceae bacterium]